MSLVRRALVAVSDKSSVLNLCQFLVDRGVELVATTGCRIFLEGHGIRAVDVAFITGFPQIMGDRVKTLHPHVHGAILADRGDDSHIADAAKYGIELIDLVIVDLYPFSDNPSIDLIDVGGPTMLRAAAKNFEHVCVVSNKIHYSRLVDELSYHGMSTSLSFRKCMAQAAFELTAQYDAAIARSSIFGLPEVLCMEYRKVEDLRYGENPGQDAAFYSPDGCHTVQQLQGKQLSYNNIIDAEAAFSIVCDFNAPTVAVVKHANPCAVATCKTISLAYERAIASDRISAFGGIVGANREIDGVTARAIISIFTEVVIALSFSSEALDVFTTKPNIRLLIAQPKHKSDELNFRAALGGLVVQRRNYMRMYSIDGDVKNTFGMRVVTGEIDVDSLIPDALFAYQVCKHVSSNAIVVVCEGRTLGIGCGQMNRVDSVRLALRGECSGATMASDGFFPFADSIQAAARAGIKCIIQPGGSKNDELVIEEAKNCGIVMFFTDMRCFRH